MKRRLLKVTLCAWCVSGAAMIADGQQYAAIDLMTAAQKAAVGVDQLSTQQKTALNDFLLDLVSRAYKKGQGACSGENANPPAPRTTVRNSAEAYLTSGGHWISTNGDGKIITLEDGSMWQISAIDQVDTMLWLPVTNITVIADPNPIGDHKYILVNKDDGEKAHAKYLGRE